jgi:Matrixin
MIKFAVILLLASGCDYDYSFWAPSFPYSVGVYSAPGIPQEASSDALEGCRVWAPLGINCHPEADASKAFVKIMPDPHPCVGDTRGNIAAETQWATRTITHSDIWLKVGCNSGIWAVLFAHEFGHAWGLEHNPHPEALMYANLTQPAVGFHLTQWDIEEFDTVWNRLTGQLR